jgi:aminopeptidase N
MHEAERPNYELYAMAAGFWHPLQEDVTVLFVEPYFAEIAEIAKVRSGWVLARLAEYTYPWTAVSPVTVELTDELLVRTDLDPGVRRSVVDAGDDLRRAVASRRRY